MTSFERDSNRVPVNGAISTIDGSSLYPLSVIPFSSVNTNALTVAIVDGSGGQISSFGGGTQYNTGSAEASPVGTVALGWDGANVKALALDGSGNLKISGSITASNPSVGTTGSSIPTSATLIGASDGTALQPLKVDGSNNLKVILENSSVAVTGTFWQSTQPISASSLPLPTGAATSAKQPSIGTAGTASVDVLTVQGIASMTALKVDGSGVTQPVSGTVTANAGTGTFNIQSNASVNLSQVAGSTTATGHGTASGSLRVELPTDGTGVVGLNAGSNLIGKVGIDQTTVGTTNAVTPIPASNTGWSFNYQSALSSTKVQIKGSAGTFGGYLWLYNPNTAVTYIQVFNKTSANVTVGTTAPDFVIALPGVASASATGSAANMEMVMGIAMSTGITVAATTTASGSTAPSNALTCTFLYK